ncbi:MAG: tyrosine-type recombinase/integrase [Alphaproteobacteria bacterium]|nr:tyrosine-type recombinase/integrase [Rickettsiales bacterium]
MPKIKQKLPILLDEQMLAIFKAFMLFLKNEKNASSNTIASYEFDIQSFSSFLKQKNSKGRGVNKKNKLSKQNFEDCNLTDCRQWIFSRISDNISNRSNARAISGVKRFFKFLNSEEIVKNSVINQMSTPKIPQKLPQIITTEMFIELCNGIEQISKHKWQALRDKAIAILMFTSGTRISETLSIKTSKIFERDKGVCVTGKGNKERIVPIIKVAKDAILEYIKAIPFKLEQNQPLFVSNKGRQYSVRLVQGCFEQARNAVNLPEYITPHTMRHSCATMLLQNSKESDSIKKIQELLGHSQLTTTQIYTHISNSSVIEALERASYWKSTNKPK